MASSFWPQFEMKSRQVDALLVFFTFTGKGDDAGVVSGPDAQFVESVERTGKGTYKAVMKVPVKHRIHPVGLVVEGANSREASVTEVDKKSVTIVTSTSGGNAADSESVHVTLALFNARLIR